ncbi:flavin reductase family protein [Chitinophaga defluvii]|uniref:Flavin reductase family protein n=1 Tax=Chitinophaga defluvii TaxID=3163343 RepID=A0ABV2SZ47_9BACT
MHQLSEPAILYFGTPVVLISTVNEDHTFNLAPMSSIFWLGWRCMIGLGSASKTTANLIRTRECVLNLPAVHQADVVNRLALTTGADPVPASKQKRGYRFVPNKFETAGLEPVPSLAVSAPRAGTCPVQLEARVVAIHRMGEEDEQQRGRLVSLELQILKVHLDAAILMDGYPNRVDPDKWRPLIMSFQEFYGLGQKVDTSVLASIPEDLYRMPQSKNAGAIS